MQNEKLHTTTCPGNAPETELYRFGADGNLRMYSYDRLFYSLYGYDGGTTRTYKYSFNLNPNWVNGRLETVTFNMHNAMFYPNSYLNFNSNGYYTKHYYNGMERIASRLGDRNISINVNNPELQDRKDWQDSLIRKNVTEITGYEFLPVGEEQNHEDPKPVFELPQIGITGLHPIGSGSVYYYHSNHLGSTCYVTDGNASEQQGFLYAPFGEITNEYNSSFGSSVLPKYSFNAKELDEETGMYYYEARYYQPPVFTSRDILFEEKPWLTPYHYCSNNPIGRIDPSGMSDDWYENENGDVMWSADVKSPETVPNENCKYIGPTYKGLTVDAYEEFDGFFSETMDPAVGLTIRLRYEYGNDSDVRWVQTVLDATNSNCDTPHIDPCNQNTPFYWSEDQLAKYRQKGILEFIDIPTVDKLANLFWKAELSVVSNEGGRYEPVMTVRYGYHTNENKEVKVLTIGITKISKFTANVINKYNNRNEK